RSAAGPGELSASAAGRRTDYASRRLHGVALDSGPRATTLTLRLFQVCPSERSRWRGGRCRVYEVGRCDSYAQINCGSQGGPCDPSTQNHAGGTPASSLLRSYHPLLHPRRRTIRSTFPVSSGSLGAAAHPGIPSPALHPEEVVTRLSNEPSLCAAIFLHPDTSKAVEHC